MSFGTTDGSLPPMNQSRSRRRPSKYSDELSSDCGPFRARPATQMNKKQLQLELDDDSSDSDSSDSDSSDSDSSDSDVPIKKKKAATKPKKTKPKKAKLKKAESDSSSSESSDSETEVQQRIKKKKTKKKTDNNTKTNPKKSKKKQKLTVSTQVVSQARQMSSSLATTNGTWIVTNGDINLLAGYNCSNADAYEWIITEYSGGPNGPWLEAEVNNGTPQMFPMPDTDQFVDLLETDIVFSGKGATQRLPFKHFEKVLDAFESSYNRYASPVLLNKANNPDYNAVLSRKIVYKAIMHCKLWIFKDENNKQSADEPFDPSKYVNTRFLQKDKNSSHYKEMSLANVVSKITSVMTRRRQTQRENELKEAAKALLTARATEAGTDD